MKFFMNMNPPTVTAQMKKVRVVQNRPVFYEPKKVKGARHMLCASLHEHKPTVPLDGALGLSVLWFFKSPKCHRDGEWRITKPDTDNLEKLLKDCMTAEGYWQDDAQVAQEFVQKRWVKDKCGIYIEIKKLEDKDNEQLL